MPNKKRKCTHCKDFHTRETEVLTPAGWFHVFECAYAHAKEKREKDRNKQAAKKKKEERRVHLQRKAKLKTVSDYIKEAQACVNRYIRARDAGLPCISCGAISEQKIGGTMEAGHYRSRGAAGHLRFNTNNINLQCVKCNRFKSGNAVDYRLGLIRKIGIDKVEALELDNAPRKFDIEYLKRVKRIFSKRARMVEKRRL
jgi:hypothetical protein